MKKPYRNIEEKILRSNYAGIKNCALACILQRSVHSIYQRAGILGLKKSKAQLRKTNTTNRLLKTN